MDRLAGLEQEGFQCTETGLKGKRRVEGTQQEQVWARSSGLSSLCRFTSLWKTYLRSFFTGFPFKARSFLLPTGSLQGVLWARREQAKLRGRQPPHLHAEPCRRGQQRMLLTACFSCFDTSKPQTETSAPGWAADSPPQGAGSWSRGGSYGLT